MSDTMQMMCFATVNPKDGTRALPEKELRTKTNGGGSHCFAIYPERMRAEIARIIRAHRAQADRQGRLF